MTFTDLKSSDQFSKKFQVYKLKLWGYAYLNISFASDYDTHKADKSTPLLPHIPEFDSDLGRLSSVMKKRDSITVQ